jgi:hypothetical protein
MYLGAFSLAASIIFNTIRSLPTPSSGTATSRGAWRIQLVTVGRLFKTSHQTPWLQQPHGGPVVLAHKWSQAVRGWYPGHRVPLALGEPCGADRRGFFEEASEAWA